jgi:hypothetical protein
MKTWSTTFGAAVMSYASGVKTASGDEYEIQAQTFGKPLRNRMVSVPDDVSNTIFGKITTAAG